MLVEICKICKTKLATHGEFCEFCIEDEISIRNIKVVLFCMVCGQEFEGEEPIMCCSGRDCGCMGMPVDPIVCSNECYDNLPFRKDRKI